MKKIKNNDIFDVRKIENQGLSWSSIYEAKYNGEKVIIKAQDKGSLEKTNSKDDKFEQEKKILELKFEHMVNLIGYGDDFFGERFLVLEFLKHIENWDDENLIRNVSDGIFTLSRQLYLEGFNWPVSKKHIMLDINNNVKFIDFNDDREERISFLDKNKYFDCFEFVNNNLKNIIKNGENIVSKESLRKLIEKEYQSLKDVHEPIFFEEYRDVPKKETDENDPNFGKLVPANRMCFDRGKIIYDEIQDFDNLKILDLGCNVGWFCFFLDEKGALCHGVDFDKDKIEFCKMLNDAQNRNCKFEHNNICKEYIENLENYDLVLALSILHLFFNQHKYSKEEWVSLFKEISKKTGKYLIFEICTSVFKHFEVSNYDQMADVAKHLGNFKNSRVIGKSNEGRSLIICEK